MRCFGPLLCRVVRLIRVKPGEKRQLALALDATSLRNQWTVLAISVLVAGCAIPVAWKVLPAQQHGSRRPYWESVLALLGDGVPRDWKVVVMADRGLYARWIWDAVVALGWHPFLRINTQSQAREVGSETFFGMSHWMRSPGNSWAGPMNCFVSNGSRLRATVLMHWEPGYEDAWIILTDLEPKQARIAWYRLRAWIEGGSDHLTIGEASASLDTMPAVVQIADRSPELQCVAPKMASNFELDSLAGSQTVAVEESIQAARADNKISQAVSSHSGRSLQADRISPGQSR